MGNALAGKCHVIELSGDHSLSEHRTKVSADYADYTDSIQGQEIKSV
jgi:hypothetical protein